MTLAEVLVALLLFGILAAFVVGVVNSVLNLWQAGERRGRGDLVFAAATERQRADVGAAHLGPRGWLTLDTWQAAPEEDGRPAWRLPRLRFLADGAIAPEADPRGRGSVEVAWIVVPEPEPGSRLCRLLRIVQAESAPRSFREEGWITAAARAGAGLVVMDGILHLEFFAVEQEEEAPRTALQVASYAPFDFPSAIGMLAERASSGARRRPVTLDADLGDAPEPFALRGPPPFTMPEIMLIEREFVRLSGTWPRFQASERGLRGSQPAEHPRGTPVWLPERATCTAPLPAQGRRLP
jgi:type II secretory pathway pseudopilin PulG